MSVIQVTERRWFFLETAISIISLTGPKLRNPYSLKEHWPTCAAENDECYKLFATEILFNARLVRGSLRFWLRGSVCLLCVDRLIARRSHPTFVGCSVCHATIKTFNIQPVPTFSAGGRGARIPYWAITYLLIAWEICGDSNVQERKR